jgi:hypothetical protein
VAKLLLMSVVLMTGVIALVGARERDARRGLLRTIAGLALFNILYALLVILVYPQICWK